MEMKEYHKIETLFKRDEKTKKLIMGEFTNPTIEYLKNNTWTFTEKIDGTNTRIFWDGHKVVFGGRTDKAEMPDHLLKRLEELFGGEVNEQLFEQKFGENQVELFGEGYGPKINSGGSYRNDVDFILFDVIINNYYQPRESIEDIAKYFNIDVVPIVLEGTIQQGIDYVLDPNNRKSVIAKNGAELEGLVGRTKVETFGRNWRRNIVKIKYKDLKDTITKEELN